jgi:phosphatidylglycerol---prolipoprotein diacylglyceryl transferase
MQFPVYLHLGPWQLHPHPVFESLAYMVAFRLALSNFRRDTIAPTQRTSILVGGMLGGLIGAKVLVLLQHIDLLWGNPAEFGMLLLQGKTVVGGLLGAIAGVEITKHYIGVKQSTGDAFVTPLIAGMMIGRVGCFLTGLQDRTYGTVTALPWGVDFGDGLLRHPTAIYEMWFLLGLFGLIRWRQGYGCRWPAAGRRPSGDTFKFFTLGYLSFRFLVDFIKPEFHPIFGVSAIQIACLAGLCFYSRSFYDFFRLAKS